MPLGLSDNLFKRVVSALSLLPVVLGLIYLGGWWFFALLAAGGILMALEWCDLTNSRSFAARLATIFIAIVPAAIVTFDAAFIPASGIAILLFVFGLFLIVRRPKTLAAVSGAGGAWGNAVAGGFYGALALISLAWLRQQDQDGLIVIWTFFAVWAMDVGGYFAGKGIGGPKLAPKLSPKKTWAGLIGGAVLASVVSLAISLLFGLGEPLLMALAGALVALVAQFGDLYESAIKRVMDKKDSGVLIPGHGGILDRVDGLVFAAPAVTLVLVIASLDEVIS